MEKLETSELLETSERERIKGKIEYLFLLSIVLLNKTLNFYIVYIDRSHRE